MRVWMRVMNKQEKDSDRSYEITKIECEEVIEND